MTTKSQTSFPSMEIFFPSWDFAKWIGRYNIVKKRSTGKRGSSYFIVFVPCHHSHKSVVRTPRSITCNTRTTPENFTYTTKKTSVTVPVTTVYPLPLILSTVECHMSCLGIQFLTKVGFTVFMGDNSLWLYLSEVKARDTRTCQT